MKRVDLDDLQHAYDLGQRGVIMLALAFPEMRDEILALRKVAEVAKMMVGRTATGERFLFTDCGSADALLEALAALDEVKL